MHYMKLYANLYEVMPCNIALKISFLLEDYAKPSQSFSYLRQNQAWYPPNN